MDSLSNMNFGAPADNDGKDVAFYLSSATTAAKVNRKKLAIHLYIAAYELEMANREVPSPEVLDGMHAAWNIACEIQDRSSAETLFTDLAPFSDPFQTERRVHQLQEMAVSQLKEMGVPGDRIEKMSIIHTPEATAAGADPDFVHKFRDLLRSANNIGDLEEEKLPEERAEEPAGPGMPAGPFPMPPWANPNEEPPIETKAYADLVGYDSELKAMCAYGFDTTGDAAYRQFLQETSEFHGVEGLALFDPFMFYGPSRDDVFEFAEATAGEIGNPVLTLHVRADDDGVWTIRLAGPFRRGLFGVTDPMDIPTPCTFVIENIDILQDFIMTAIRTEMMQRDDEGMPPHGHHMYGEIVGYIHAIMQKPGVFPIITAKESIELIPQFDGLFDRARRIKVENPTFEERKNVWNRFAMGHTSFSEIDIDELSRLSEGISRHDLVAAGSNAVRDAYQESLSTSKYRFVSIKDVLFEMMRFASQDDSAYSAMEDAAAAAFASELDDLTFEDNPEDPA